LNVVQVDLKRNKKWKSS